MWLFGKEEKRRESDREGNVQGKARARLWEVILFLSVREGNGGGKLSDQVCKLLELSVF